MDRLEELEDAYLLGNSKEALPGVLKLLESCESGTGEPGNAVQVRAAMLAAALATSEAQAGNVGRAADCVSAASRVTAACRDVQLGAAQGRALGALARARRAAGDDDGALQLLRDGKAVVERLLLGRVIASRGLGDPCDDVPVVGGEEMSLLLDVYLLDIVAHMSPPVDTEAWLDGAVARGWLPAAEAKRYAVTRAPEAAPAAPTPRAAERAGNCTSPQPASSSTTTISTSSSSSSPPPPPSSPPPTALLMVRKMMLRLAPALANPRLVEAALGIVSGLLLLWTLFRSRRVHRVLAALGRVVMSFFFMAIGDGREHVFS